MKTVFETEICSRCHGSGKYSFCERFADICFKCSGQTVVLTKRGLAAKVFLEELCTKRAEQLVIGDRVSTRGMTNGGGSYTYVATIVSISERADNVISTSFIGPRHKPYEVVSEHPKYGRICHLVYGDSKFRVYPTDNADRIAKALEYQAKLTKMGKVRKAG